MCEYRNDFQSFRENERTLALKSSAYMNCLMPYVVYHSEIDAISTINIIIKNSISFVSISLFIIHTVPSLVMSLLLHSNGFYGGTHNTPVIIARYFEISRPLRIYNFNGTDLQSERWNRSDFYFVFHMNFVTNLRFSSIFLITLSSQIIFKLNNYSSASYSFCFHSVSEWCFAFQIFWRN